MTKVAKYFFKTEKNSKLMAKFFTACIILLLIITINNTLDQIFIGQGVGYLGNKQRMLFFLLW